MENANTSINAEDISVEITRFYDDEANGKSVAFDENTATFDYSYEKNKLKKPKVHIKVKNNSDKNLYFSALYCSEVYGIGNQFMKKQLINAGGEAFFLNPPTPDNEGKDKRDIYFNIDSDLTKIGITEVEDYVKLLISTEAFETDYLNQADYKVDMATPLRGASGKEEEEAIEEDLKRFDWTTKTYTFKIIRPNVSGNIAGISVVFPTEVSGEVSAVSESYAKRGIANTPRRTLQGFETFAIGSEGHRSLNTSAIELSNVRNGDKISAENPLKLRLSAKENDETQLVVAFAIDEKTGYYYPIGLPNSQKINEIAIFKLPEPSSNGTRGVLETFKMFLYRASIDRPVFRWTVNQFIADFLPLQQLRIVNVTDVNAPVQYENINTLQGKKRILLYIHGILGDTLDSTKSVRKVIVKGKPLASYYDVVLTFDYESLSTGIFDTAKILKQKQEEAQLDADAQIELF